LVLGLLFGALGLVWLTAYSFLVARAGDFLRRSGIRRALDGLTGAVLVVSASGSRWSVAPRAETGFSV
jgi:threonine/homoserine/homoserine lactone efflux protein